MAPIRRISAAMLIGMASVLGVVYFTVFHHPPAEVILSNQVGQPISVERFDLDPLVPHSMVEISEAAWGKWLYNNKYVAIGDIYDTVCEDKDKITIGKTILLPDKTTGGVKTKLYINTTLETTVQYGDLHVEAYYNGKLLYNNTLDLCTAEEGDDVRILTCPIARGNHYLIKEIKLSNLLPKGNYKAKAVVINQDKKAIMCAEMGFRL